MSFDFDIRYRSGKSNRNADALSRLHPPPAVDLETIVPGTLLPQPLKRALRARGPPACQASVQALPHHPFSDISELQCADPVIHEVLAFWRQQCYPNCEDRKKFAPPALALLKQWGRLVEQTGVVYRQVSRSDGGGSCPPGAFTSCSQRPSPYRGLSTSRPPGGGPDLVAAKAAVLLAGNGF